jgi:uncharacterized membrane protein
MSSFLRRIPAQLVARHGGWVRPLAIIVCCAYPFLNHFAATRGEPRLAALGIALVVWALATGWLSALAATLVSASAFALLLWLAARLPGLLLYAPPVAINLALLAFFARTLRAGDEPLVTRIARIERGGSLPEDLARYTLNLTRAWVAFFALMAAISVTLAVTGPVAAWSLFSNALNYLLVALFFVLEYIYRRLRYRHHPHASPRQMIRLLRNFRVVPDSHGQPAE